MPTYPGSVLITARAVRHTLTSLLLIHHSPAPKLPRRCCQCLWIFPQPSRMIPVITLSDNILSLLVWQHPILPPLHKVHSMSLPITHTIPNLRTLTNFQPTISKRGKRHQEKGQLSAVLLSYTHPAGTLCSNKPEIVFSGACCPF